MTQEIYTLELNVKNNEHTRDVHIAYLTPIGEPPPKRNGNMDDSERINKNNIILGVIFLPNNYWMNRN